MNSYDIGLNAYDSLACVVPPFGVRKKASCKPSARSAAGRHHPHRHDRPRDHHEGSPLAITGNTALTGGGVVAFYSAATTLTHIAVTTNHAGLTTGGVYRQGGT
jgi:hypothetical protein